MTEATYQGPRRVRLEVDRAALRKNYERIAGQVSPCRIMPVLKADAYHLGARELGKLVRELGAFRIGAADLPEALELKQASGLDVQILGVVTPDELACAVENNIIIPLNGLTMAKTVSAEAVRQQRMVRTAVSLDTGMGRFGLRPEIACAEIRLMKALPGLDLEGVYSHFPMAGEPNDPGSLQQIEDFKKILETLKADGIEFAYRHIAASNGITCQPPAIRDPFNLVRLGLVWYGVEGVRSRALGMLPAVRLTTVVGAVRELPAGATIGYYRICKLKEKTRVATICAGYSDGLPLALSNCGRVLINGTSCPVLGRLSMDYTMVDVSKVPGPVDWGTPVTLWGTDGAEHIDLSEHAGFKHTHEHDLLCALGTRVERVYIH